MNQRVWIKLGKRMMLVLLAVLLVALAGCNGLNNVVSGMTAPAGEYPVEIDGVTISSKPAKVVVLTAGLADVVTALGLETQLVAGPAECTQPSLRSLTKINTGDVQEVLTQNPDLVLGSLRDDAMAEALEGARVPYLCLPPATDRGSYERLLGKVSAAFTGDGVGYDNGVSAAQSIFSTLDDINRVVPKEKITTACYLYDLSSRAVTGDMFGDTIMTYAGVTNVFKSLTGGEYTFDALDMANPTVIFCDPAIEDQLKHDTRFGQLNAVEAGRVFPMDPSMMEWQGRTVISAALEISGDAFPELLEESSMEVSDPVSQIESEVSSAIESSAQQEEQSNAAYTTLQTGDDNDEVLRLQTRLSELGYLTAEYDGYYGQVTAAAVEEFQIDNGLQATGVADAATQRVLYNRDTKTKAEQGASGTSAQ